MVQFLSKLLLKQIFLAGYHEFHSLLAATKLLTAKLNSGHVEESEIWNGRARKFWKGRSWSQTFYVRLRDPGVNFT